MTSYKTVLENIYKIYQIRYLESLKNIGDCRTIMNDIHTIDYVYKYFRDKLQISEKYKDETLINKVLLAGKDLPWRTDKISLLKLFRLENRSFKDD